MRKLAERNVRSDRTWNRNGRRPSLQSHPSQRRDSKKAAEGAESKVKSLTEGPPPSPVKALTYKDPFNQVYKKYLFTVDGKYLLGGMMIGDTSDYIKLVPMVKNQKPMEIQPSELIVGSQTGENDTDDL